LRSNGRERRHHRIGLAYRKRSWPASGNVSRCQAAHCRNGQGARHRGAAYAARHRRRGDRTRCRFRAGSRRPRKDAVPLSMPESSSRPPPLTLMPLAVAPWAQRIAPGIGESRADSARRCHRGEGAISALRGCSVQSVADLQLLHRGHINALFLILTSLSLSVKIISGAFVTLHDDKNPTPAACVIAENTKTPT
jgi:hypothetical protein